LIALWERAKRACEKTRNLVQQQADIVLALKLQAVRTRALSWNAPFRSGLGRLYPPEPGI